MTKYKVKTTAVIDYNPVGSIIELSKNTAEYLSEKGYVHIIEEVKNKKTTAKTKSKGKKDSDKKE